MSYVDNLLLGLDTALAGTNLMYCFLGVTLGMIVGVLPGVGAMVAVVLLLPMTFYMDPTSAVVMLAGVFYGGAYGGSITSILLNVPGSASSAVACLDGYPMARQGRAGVALMITTLSSFCAASIGIIVLMVLAPVIAQAAVQLRAADYFSIMALGLVAASTMSIGTPVKSLAMVVLGILLGIVGTDVSSGLQRFTFGHPELFDGIALVAVAMGLFGIAEVIFSVGEAHPSQSGGNRITFRSMIPTRDDMRRFWMPMFRGSAIGCFFGTLPGTGPSIASFMSYAVEKRVAKDPDRFGKGAVEGITAPEAANNAADQTAFIPTLSLGIPGTPVMAVLLSALLIHGITPGPALVNEQPVLFWGLVMSFWVGNLMLLVLNIPLIGLWVRLLQIPYHLLYPAILMFVCVGLYTVENSVFQVFMLLGFGALGYVLRLLNFSPAPLILGFILGPMVEENLRRTLSISRGSFMVFIERPVTAITSGLTLLLLAWTLWRAFRPAQSRVAQEAGG